MPVFTPHQDAALTAAAKWFKAQRGGASIFRLFGYAGTGKTTLAKHMAKGVDGKVLFAAFTGAEHDAMLTELHRQARDNPIILLSMDIRAGNALAEGQYGDTQVVRRAALDPKRVLDADQVLVGRNVTRRAYNARLRERRGFTEALPMAGDKLVCLRNNRRKGLFNGGLWGGQEAANARRAIP